MCPDARYIGATRTMNESLRMGRRAAPALAAGGSDSPIDVEYHRCVSYELWDTETRNMVAAFGSEAEALWAARELETLHPGEYPGALALVFENEEGESTLVARGAGLATRARLVN